MSTTKPTKLASLGRAVKAPLFLLCALAILALGASIAQAETPGPGWELTSQTYPTNLPPGATGQIVINVLNVGAADSSGPVTVTDALPPGVEATEAGVLKNGTLGQGPPSVAHEFWDCAGTSVVTCTNDEAQMPHIFGGGLGIDNGPEEPGEGHTSTQIAIAVRVGEHVAEGVRSGGEANRVTIAGGGAPTPASTTEPVTISSAPPSGFGIVDWDGWFSNADGTIDKRAGSHPYEATFNVNLATERKLVGLGDYGLASGQEFKNLQALLPPGFIGDPGNIPQCPQSVFDEGETTCPANTQIGILSVFASGGAPFHYPVYNLIPPAGSPADFGVNLLGVFTTFEATIRSGGDYGITTHINDIPRKNIVASVLTLWGIPGEHTGAPDKPFLTLPTACGEAQPFSLRANTWQNEAAYTSATVFTHNAADEPAGFTGCESLQFAPAISTAPDTSAADTPAGLTVEVTPPLGGLSQPQGLSPADIQDTTVTLPAGVVINPGQAAGLQACQAGTGLGTDDLPLPGENGEEERFAGPPECPPASKVGVVKIRTPLLEGEPENELEGNVYVLQSNPPELKLLVAASADGVNVKLIGVVHLSATGQLTTTFAGTPELPFTDFKLSFSGGEKAALDTPTQCGTYGPEQGFSANFTPWATPFLANVATTAEFTITHGPGGGPCPSNPLPFNPQLIAGATTDQAGGFTNFSLLLQRGDGQQRIDGLRFKAPEGLTGFLSNVPLCTNAQAETNTCPAASKIGHTVVEAGPGPYPLVVPEPGQEPAPIYLTESYNGAPFGLSIVVPLHVGPFTLETQRVRAKIEVNPYTSALTVTTNPLPQEVDGVPTDLREIDAVIEHPEFMVNPTDCNPQEFSGTAYGTPPPGAGGPGASAAISSHFQVGACRALEFAPKFSVTTSGKTSKANGASLTAKVSYPGVPQGTDADIGLVKVELPKQLPSRLTTLQKACTAAQFEANPAGCPPASFIGHAVVHTPLLPVPLEGPAIFVSHGGEAFPSLTIVLQGDGVTVDLVGATFINKAGVTSTTFKTVPDDPFSIFELTLPEGKYSALAANGNLCTSKLTMPNEFVGQNGAVLKQTTKITVTGCVKKKTLTRAQRLTAALKVCHKKAKGRRASCEKTARKRYGPLKAKRKSKGRK